MADGWARSANPATGEPALCLDSWCQRGVVPWARPALLLSVRCTLGGRGVILFFISAKLGNVLPYLLDF